MKFHFGKCLVRPAIPQGGTPLQNALRGAKCERPETQPDAMRPLRFSEQTRQAEKSILSGVRLFLFSIFFFWP